MSGFTEERIGLIGNAATLIDVGVASGTDAVYGAYPDAELVLIEPLADYYEAEYAQLQQSGRLVTVFPVAVGDHEGEATITIEENALTHSSLLKRTELTSLTSPKKKKKVPVKRLDQLIDERFPKPFGIKIDGEGNELNILKGAEGLFEDVDFFIIEVSMAKRFEGSHTFEELIAYMDAQGFHAFDILDINRKDPRGTRHLDMVFLPRGHA